MYKSRIGLLRQKMESSGFDTMFISKLADIKWLSGYSGTTAFILITPEKAVFITDGRYETQCRQQLAPFWELVIVTSYGATFAEVGKKYSKLTLQPEAPLSLWVDFTSAGSTVSVDKQDILMELRMWKTPEEISSLKREYALAGEAFLKSLEGWQYGQTEREWAALLEYNMKRLGADGPSFETIIASGERGALPHGVASDKVIHSGEAVTIDYGSSRDYASDYTRVVYDGSDAEILKVITIVREALEKAQDKVRTGVKCQELDKIAREHIVEAGYGAYFNHSLGHGVGMEVHERPNINAKSATVLECGMVFTLEPGIYLPGRFGIRLEQTVAVKETGCELLSNVLDRYIYTLK